MDPNLPEYESDLVELGALPLADVLELGDSVLAHAVRQVQREADYPEDLVAGWNSAI